MASFMIAVSAKAIVGVAALRTTIIGFQGFTIARMGWFVKINLT